MGSTEYAIQAEGLVKTFGETKALRGVDLAVRPGSVLGVLGPNGAGKTTAVRILATLIRPDAGHARVGGYDVVREAHRVRELIGLTGQYASVDEELSATENLVMIARLLELSRRESKARARELLADFDLTDAAKRPVSTFSGGMRRRLDLAASMVGRPALLYLDEPTTGLDPHARNEVWIVVRRLVAQGVTVLLTTQYLDEADQLANDITVIDHGIVAAHGTPGQLRARTGSQTLEIRPSQTEDITVVRTIVHEITGAVPHETDGLVRAPVDDQKAMSEAVRRLDDAGIRVEELSLRLPSLDEVFLAITGHRADDESHDNEKEAVA